jgi:hypothetical protein
LKVSVRGEPAEHVAKLNKKIDPSVVQAFGPALVDFLPVRAPVTADVCTDNYSDWQVDLTFLDGSQLQLKTHQSNLYTLGAPWQTSIDGQEYVQFSPDLVRAIYGLFSAMELPLGEPYAMYCSWVDVFDQAFPVPEK